MAGTSRARATAPKREMISGSSIDASGTSGQWLLNA
jgi:hypothetical protein